MWITFSNKTVPKMLIKKGIIDLYLLALPLHKLLQPNEVSRLSIQM